MSNQGAILGRQHLDRLFDRFYRVDTARARDGGGSGLGLSIVQAIMRLHGGTAQVSTESGLIRFKLLFPLA